MKRITLIFLFALIGLACIFGLAIYRSIQNPQYVPKAASKPTVQKVVHGDFKVPHFSAEQFDLAGKLKGLSKKQIQEHEALYNGYVKKRNEIQQKLQTVDRSTATNTTYSPYRALKLAQTYAMNGDILHRLYFGNLATEKTEVGPQMEALINESFGSMDAYKEDLFASAKSSRGWVVTGYTIDSGLIENYVLEAHNLTVPVMVMPLVVLDVYEHAYMIDFGINRGKYIDVFWNDLDWNVVEDRINKWVNLFRKTEEK